MAPALRHLGMIRWEGGARQGRPLEQRNAMSAGARRRCSTAGKQSQVDHTGGGVLCSCAIAAAEAFSVDYQVD